MNTSINVILLSFVSLCFVSAGAMFTSGNVLGGLGVGCLGILAAVLYERTPPSTPSA